MSDGGSPDPDHEQRFERLIRLYGAAAVARLDAARVVIFGVGGVGSFVAEALVRSAIGHLWLVDSDEVTLSNTNRQLQAQTDTVGLAKAVALRDRLRLVNPGATIDAIKALYRPVDAERLLTPPWPGSGFDFVVDCIDDLGAKAHLLATCRERALNVVSSMGAGSKTDPTRIRATDLATTDICPLAQQLRKRLRQKHGFPRTGSMGITAIYSDEAPRLAPPPPGAPTDSRPPHGTAVFVTGAFGLVGAAQVINRLVTED